MFLLNSSRGNLGSPPPLYQQYQHHPPGAQENYSNFTSGNPISKHAKELYFPKGGKGFEGGSEGVGGSPSLIRTSRKSPKNV